MEKLIDYSEKTRAKISVGVRGENDGQFDWPRGLAVDLQSDNIFVSERDVDKIQVFNEKGKFVYKFRTVIPRNFFLCLTGNLLYTSNFYGHSISVYTVNGDFITTYGRSGKELGRFTYPQGIAVDEELNKLFICDRDNDRVQVLGGFYIHAITRAGDSTLATPRDLKYVSGDLYVMDKNHVHIFKASSPYTHQRTILEVDYLSKNPYYFVIDLNMNILLSNYKSNSIQVYNKDGKLIHTINTPGDANGPNGIALTRKGDIVCVSANKESGILHIF